MLPLAKTVATIITLLLMRMVSDKNVQHLRRVFMPSIVLVLVCNFALLFLLERVTLAHAIGESIDKNSCNKYSACFGADGES